MFKKRSAVWRHFKDSPGNKVSCCLCNKHFTKHGNTSFMLRHLRRKHPHLIEDLMELDAVTPSAAAAWGEDPHAQVDDIDACVEDLNDNRKRSAVWLHFREYENKKVSCVMCNEKLARQGNTSSMLRHMRRKHPEVNIPLLPTDNTLKRKSLHLRSCFTESRFLAVCERLLRNNVLTDCTLVVDGQFLEAHRLVLASCSESFEEIFKTVTQPNPVIVLRDMTMPELKGLISFMYKGEALVKSNEVPGLLKAAAELRVKGLSQVGNSEWIDHTATPSSGEGATRMPNKEEFSYYHQDEQNYDNMEEVQSHSGYSKQQATLDLMTICEEVDLDSGTPSNKTNRREEQLLKRLQIKLESGVDIVDGDQPSRSHLHEEAHTATHYISAGEEVVLHQEGHEMQHGQRADGTIQATVTMSHGDPICKAIKVTRTAAGLGGRTITTSMAGTSPAMEVGNMQQPTATTHTIDEDGLILLGLSGGETHTTIISAGPSAQKKTSTKTLRPTGHSKLRQYTRQDVSTAIKLVHEGHMGLKPSAKAFNIPATTIFRANKKRDFAPTQGDKD